MEREGIPPCLPFPLILYLSQSIYFLSQADSGPSIILTIIGCPKLDAIDYSEKLTQLISDNDINSVTIVRMEVLCCGGWNWRLKKRFRPVGDSFHGRVGTITVDGAIKKAVGCQEG